MANLVIRNWRSRFYKLLNVHKACSSKTKQEFSSQASSKIQNGGLVIVEKDDYITLIGLNRSESRNSIDNETAKCLSEALIAFEEDRSSPVAVIYGIGGSFCTGQDLAELENRCDNKDLKENFYSLCNHYFLHRHPRKPLICGINGYCIADGLELAMLCDLRVMEDTAILGFFNRPAGLHLRCGGSARLPAIVGYSRALDLLLTGRRVSGREALEMGLANRLVATGTVLGQAVNLAFSIAKFPFESLQRDRNNMYINCYERRKGIHAAILHETKGITANIKREFKEGFTRFQDSKIREPTDIWQVKKKVVPDWEQEEILHELRHSLKTLKK